MMLQPDRYWDGFCRAVERPDLAGDERHADGRKRFENREALFAAQSLAAWRTRLDRQEGPWAPMQVASPVQFDEASPALAASPAMGQNTGEVLLETGFSWDDLAGLKKIGAIL